MTMRSFLKAAVVLATTAASIFPVSPGFAAAAPWWANSVIYEIYPRSFQDSDGDGVGDLNGITQRLDYLKSMHVDAIWLTPIYPSPQADFGYDISDFEAIDPLYGTMADFDRLMAEAKKRKIRVIMDLVLNHTSDEHPWFRESQASRSSPKRDWYVWQDGKPNPLGGPPLAPNNWRDRIQQSPWQWDPATGQFYYHYYHVRQPDLNWRNPAVQKAMFAAAEFWLRKGVAGFRLDAINTLFEDSELRDAPPGPGTNEYGEPAVSQERQRNLPQVHDVLVELRKITDSYPGDRVMIGEIYTYSTKELERWYGVVGKPEIQLPMNTNIGFLNRLDAPSFRKLMTESEAAFSDRTPVYVFDNHDRPRSWDRYGDGRNNQAIAKMIATILLATRGTALIYQGQEIGMTTTTPTRLEDVRDPRGIAGWPKEKGRDGERTPMQWQSGPGAGFTSALNPWLPIPSSAETVNVSAQVRKTESLLEWYRSLLKLKRKNASFRDGPMTVLDRDRQNVLAWLRTGKQNFVVAINMSDHEVEFSLEHTPYSQAILRPVMTSTLPLQRPARSLHLKAFETIIAKIES